MKTTEPVPAAADDTIDVIAFARLLWRYRVLIAIVTGVFGAAAVVLALTANLIYRAEVVVTPVADSGLGDAASSLAGQLGGLASIAGINLGSSGVATQEARAVLASRRLVEEFIRRNALVDEMVSAGIPEPTVWFAVQRFRESVMSINTDDADGTTTLAIEWTDPVVAAGWANGLVALANELMRTRALADANRNIEYLKKQVAATNVVEIQRVMYSLIENETKTLMLANARADYAFTVVDPAAAPEARVRPKRKLMVATGLALGLILGALFAFGHDTVRRYRMREAAGARAGT
ncbi:MAG TPA: Wzz/FepE/Etk N-terminal domain-containing protein [Steroidobacteraceae bacterium]